MKECADCKEHLFEYADGEASAAVRKALEAHLEGCAPCRHQVRQMVEPIDRLRELPPLQLGETARRRIRARLNAEGREASRPSFWSYWRLWVPSAAAAIAIAAFFLVMGPPTARTPLPPVATVAVLHIEAGSIRVNDDDHAAGSDKVGQVRLGEGDVVRIGSGARTRLVYPGGILFEPKAGSHFEVFARKVHLEVGDTWVTLEKQGKGFVVSTPVVAVTVRGTIFRVVARADGTGRVELKRGSVHVRTAAGETLMAAGSSLEAGVDGTFRQGTGVPRGGTKPNAGPPVRDDTREENLFDPRRDGKPDRR